MKKFLKVLACFICIVFVLLFPTEEPILAAQFHSNRILITVKASPSSNYASSLEVLDDRQLLRSFTRNKAISTNLDPDLPRAYLTVTYRKTTTEYVVDSSLRVFYKNEKKLLNLTPNSQRRLLKYIEQTEYKHYGDAMSWNQVQMLFPRRSRAHVTDLETGKSFTVERRAGSSHADVQPVTKEDTFTMKEIYNGKWSWNRRAILVQIGNQKIAASMNGMPHGAGAIQGNQFPGHFCIHFKDSTTHRSKKQDFAHHLMIVKAAGRLDSEILQATPKQLVCIVITALDQQDYNILRLTINGSNEEKYNSLVKKAKKIQNIKLVKIEDDKQKFNLDHDEKIELPVVIAIAVASKERRQSVFIQLERDSVANRWKVDVDSLEAILPN